MTKSYWSMLSEYAVPAVAQESPYKYELAREWMKSSDENICCAGWSTYIGIILLDNNETLDLQEISGYLDTNQKNIHTSQNRVRYIMNAFVIAVGSFVPELHEKAKKVAAAIGKVQVDMGGTSCKVPLATEYSEICR